MSPKIFQLVWVALGVIERERYSRLSCTVLHIGFLLRDETLLLVYAKDDIEPLPFSRDYYRPDGKPIRAKSAQ